MEQDPNGGFVTTSDQDEVQLGYRKVIQSGIAAGATYAFTQLVPGFEDVPAEVKALIPLGAAYVAFVLIPEKVRFPNIPFQG